MKIDKLILALETSSSICGASILLNDEFEGGEFEIFTNEKHVVELKKKDIILFHADTPHRVREVTSGVRKSLVGWTQGPAYK